MRESRIETKLVKEVEALGGLCLKFNSLSMNGVPDRIVLTPRTTFFVELKAPGKKLRPLQLKRRRQFLDLKLNYAVVSSMKDVRKFINFLRKRMG